MTTNSSLFDAILKRTGSRYAAVNEIARLARQKSKEMDYDIFDSEALEWVLTGEKPYTIIDKEERIRRRRADYMRGILAEVSNPYIITSVLSSLRISAQNGVLCYVYDERLDSKYQARVRVLCNQLYNHEYR